MNLQATLLGLGVLIVVGIYGYSRWQQGRKGSHRPQTGGLQNPEFDQNRSAVDHSLRGANYTAPRFGPILDPLTSSADSENERAEEFTEEFDEELVESADYSNSDDESSDPTLVRYISDEEPLLTPEPPAEPLIESIVRSEQEANSQVDSFGSEPEFSADNDYAEDRSPELTADTVVQIEEDDDDFPILDSRVDEEAAEEVNVAEVPQWEQTGADPDDVPDQGHEAEHELEQQTHNPTDERFEISAPETVQAPNDDIDESPPWDSPDNPVADSAIASDSNSDQSEEPDGSDSQSLTGKWSASLTSNPDLTEINNEFPDEFPDGPDDHWIQTHDEAHVESAADASDHDIRDERSSLRNFLDSFQPLNRIRDSLNSKLEAVKAERTDSDLRDNSTVSEEEKNRRKRQTDLLESLSEISPDISDESPEQPVSVEAEPDLPAPSEENTRREPVLATLEVEPAEEKMVDTGSADNSPALPGTTSDQAISPAPGFEKLSQIDYYVKLSGDRDVSRDSVLGIYRDAASGLSKAHSVYGLRLPDKVWRNLEHEPEESRFGDLVVTIQLADTDGSVSERDLTRFSSLVMKLSESTGRGFSFMAPIESAYQQAEAIEQFRRRFDSIFVVNIRPLEDDMFEGATIDRCASQIGLIADENNFYARHKPVGKQKVCLYSLANMTDTGEFDIGNMRGTRTKGVTFFTRPAVNRSPGAVFAEMVDTAKAFASRVKGEVIAPGHDDLSMEDVEAIRRSIEKVAREMESYGIAPGSEEAGRLF